VAAVCHGGTGMEKLERWEHYLDAVPSVVLAQELAKVEQLVAERAKALDAAQGRALLLRGILERRGLALAQAAAKAEAG